MIEIRDLDFYYGTNQALQDITLEMYANQATAFIGPSGCGKSTLLRCINRMNDLIEGARLTRGEVVLAGENVYDADVDPIALRRRVGMVFQESNPFPRSIYENVTYGLRIQGIHSKARLDEAVEESLRLVSLWDDVKDLMHRRGTSLSAGHQQLLCIARAIAPQPDILLMDEPCSSLDPVASAKIEELIHELKSRYTIVIVTHNMQQAARVSDRTAFFYLGRLIEIEDTEQIFINPRNPQTEAYISGRFG